MGQDANRLAHCESAGSRAKSEELDHPNRRLTRMKRELSNFQFRILQGKSHLTAIVAGFIPTPRVYIHAGGLH